MADLLAGENLAGQNLLSIVSRGSAIIAELLRLSDHIPPVFYLADKADQTKYGAILHDFSYLRNIEVHENRISSDVDLVDLDEEFRESHMELLARFYRLFESIYKYVKDLTRYLEDVEEGVYIQMRLEDVLASDIGKQLLAEAFFLYGLMLTLMDNRIEGPVRERMLICYYRYKGSSDTHSAVCNLCRSTGYLPTSQKRPPKYPEEYFARLPPPIEVVKMVVSRLRSDDIYKQMKEWPSPQHRTTALANQAAILYVVLFFVPDTLHKENAAMREIVDKHFSDNWVISFYMGFVVDLSIMWEPYKAAMAALKNTLDAKHVKDIHEAQVHQIVKSHDQLATYLTEGVLTEEALLDKGHQILNCLRDCNATLRWAMLHRNCRNKKLRDTVCASLIPDRILLLLLHTAQLEFRVTELYKTLLATREDRWAKARLECVQRVTELAHFFSGEQVLTRNIKDEKLQKWFLKMAGEIASLDAADATVSGRKMQQLLSAMEDVEQFHQIESNQHVKHFLGDARELLRQMVRTVNVREQTLATLAAVGDLSYAFDIISDYLPLMHALVKKDPFSVLLLRATFLKLASVLELPLVRINQAGSPDLESVAEYYSSQLVAFVRRVLEVVPSNMFVLLNDIIAVQTRSMKVLPARLERAELREFAQFEERYRLARSTHQVSVFTEGVLAMEKTLMGIIEVDPKKLLQDGIRKELVRQISMALHGSLVFSAGSSVQEFERKVEELSRTLEGFRVSFEYISDYVSIYGLKIWQEELSRIINLNVERECNVFERKKKYEWESKYQSTAIRIPLYPPTDEFSVTFIGRLVRELLIHSDPHTTTFFDAHSGWLDASGKEQVGTRVFSLLHRSISTVGLCGLDRTLGFLIMRDLNDLVRVYKRQVLGGLKTLVDHMQAQLSPTSTLPALADKLYKAALDRTARLWPVFAEGLARVGQAQLIRRLIAAQLNFSSKLDAATLSSALEAMNEAVLNDVAAHYRDPEVHAYPSEDKGLLSQLSPYLDTLGFTCPMLKVYIATEAQEGLAAVLALFVISQMPLYKYDKKVGLLMPLPKSGAADSTAVVAGVLSLLKQFHLSVTHKCLAYLAQYVRCQVVLAARDAKQKDVPVEAINILVFVEELCKYGHIQRALVHQHLPPYVLDVLAHSV